MLMIDVTRPGTHVDVEQQRRGPDPRALIGASVSRSQTRLLKRHGKLRCRLGDRRDETRRVETRREDGCTWNPTLSYESILSKVQTQSN